MPNLKKILALRTLKELEEMDPKERKKYETKSQQEYKIKVHKLSGYCKIFEKYLSNTDDDPSKWHLEFEKTFKEYLKSKKTFSRTNTLLKDMLKKLKKGKNGWDNPEYYADVFKFKPKLPNKSGYIKRSAIDDKTVAEFFNKKFSNAILNHAPGSKLLDHVTAEMIISQYLNDEKDIINLAKMSNKYKDNLKNFKFNPIPLNNKETRDLFPNIETQYIYEDGVNEIFGDGKIKSHLIQSYHFMANGELKNCNTIKHVTISGNVGKIPFDAFRHSTNLKSVTILKGVNEIGARAFENCTSLKSVTIPESVYRIHSNAFSGCTSLESVTIPQGVVIIDGSAFENCTSLKSVKIPSSIKIIGIKAFEGCYNELELIFDNGVNANLDIFFGRSGNTTIKHKGPLSYVQKERLRLGLMQGIKFKQI